MRKRITSLLLTLVMLLSLVPAMGVTASAAEWTTVNSFKELQDAVKGKKEYIKLGQDIDTASYNEGIGLLKRDELTFDDVYYYCTLDLNGKTLALVSNDTNISQGIYIGGYSHLTIKDTSPAKTGKISGAISNVFGGQSAKLIRVNGGTLTLEGGTFTVTSHPHKTNAIVIDSLESFITIKDGVKIIQPEFFDCGYAYDLDGSGYTLMAENSKERGGHVTIEGGEFDGCVKLTGHQDTSDTNGSVQISGGTFKKDVQVLYTAEENNSNPAVTVSGGTFEGTVYLQEWPWRTSLYMPYRLNGGTFKGTVDFDADGGIYDNPTGNPNIARGLDKCFGYSAVVTPNDTFTGPDASTAVLKKTTSGESYKMLLEGNESNPVQIIPNAWGMMESVTLNGKPIDYAKDWDGTPVVIKNNEDHTITFKWKDLADELKTAGYRYDAYCMRYTSGDTSGLIPTDQIPSGTEYRFTIPKGKDPAVYSFDLRLDLKKGSNPVNTFANVHIVRLVVVEAPAADTRTPIDSVTLNVPKLSEGATSGADFTLSGTNTGVSTINTVWEGIPASGGAVAGKFYVARITLTAEDGYAFNTKTQVKLNGDYSSKGSGIDNGGAGMTVLVSVPVRHEHTFSGEWQNLNNDKEYHFKTCSCGAQEKEPHNLVYNESLDKYQCSCGYEMKGTKTEIQFVAASPRSPIDGESPNNYTPEQWVHNIGKNYTVASIDWKDEDGNAVTTFESGKIYKGTVTFKADDRFKFDKDRIQFDRIFETSTTETVEGYNLDEGATTLIATFKLKDNTVVRPGLQVKVKLPTLNDKIGQSFPAAELVDTNLPDDVELTTSVYENIFDDPITGSVAPNKTYFYRVKLQLEGGSDVTKAYNVSYTVTDGGDAVYHTDDLAGSGILARYQTPAAPDTSKISSVALTVTAPKYGDAPATTATGANDTLYDVGEPTWSPAVTDDKFGAAAYTVSIPVTAKSGYSFDANCIYTVNGYVATYADVKVSYTFPALTGPHTHDYSGQPYLYLDPGNHYQECTAGDDYNIQAHTFTAWTDNRNGTHSRHCTVCKMTDGTNYTETAEHTWVWVVDQEAALNQPGKQHEECTGCHAKHNENTEIPALRDYAVTVTGGTAAAAGTPITRAMEGVEVTVTAQAPIGKHFVKWVVKAGGVTLANETSATTTFIMPATDVAIEANFEKNASTGTGTGATTYPITVKSAKNGDVTASHKSAAKGTTITLTVDPDKGYLLDTLTVLDGNDKELKLTEKNGKYTFTMPDSKVTVAATFKASAPTGKNPFIDVPAGAYYEDAVVWAVGKNITTGMSAAAFDPNGSCTRAQIVTFLWRAAGSPEPKTMKGFDDVASKAYYAKAVAWAVENGITTGTSASKFSPNDPCTRTQAVTFLFRYAAANGMEAVTMQELLSGYADAASVPSYAVSAMNWALAAGILQGDGVKLMPNATCTRAQIVTFLYRAMK